MCESPRNFNAKKPSMFGQKSDDNAKRQSMQISPNSLGLGKYENTPARTNSHGVSSNFLEVRQPKVPSKFHHFSLTQDTQSGYDGKIQGGDSLRSSYDIQSNVFRRLSRLGRASPVQKGQVPEFSEKSIDQPKNLFKYELSCELASKEESQSKMSNSKDSGPGVVADKEELGLSENLLVPKRESRNRSSRHSKREDSSGPLLPVKSSRRRISNLKSLKSDKAKDPIINVFKDTSDESSIQSKNQGAPSVITFRRNSKSEMLSSYSGDNHSYDSKKRVYRKSNFINPMKSGLYKKSKKTSSSSTNSRKYQLVRLREKLTRIGANFKIENKLDHIDKQIFTSIKKQIEKMEDEGEKALNDVMKVK